MEITLKTLRVAKKQLINKPEIEEDTGALLLRSTWRGRIPGHSTAIINTGLAVEIPEGYYGLILNPNLDHTAVKSPALLIKSYTVPATYRDEIKIHIINYSPYPESINVNQIIAKLIIQPKLEINQKGVSKLKTTEINN